MKKILFGFLLSITAASFVSCDMNDPNEGRFGGDPESGWVEFTQPYEEIMTDTVFYAGCDIAVPLTLSAPVNTDGVDVFYTITDIEGSSAGLETYASIPANGRSGSFVVTNSEILTAPVEFSVTLTSTSNPGISGKYPDSPDQVMIVRIVPLSQAYFATFNVAETSFEGEFNYDSVISAGTAPNEFIASNLYGVDPNSETTFTINPDGTLSFPAFADNFLYTANIPNPNGGPQQRFFEGISGAADACTGVITMSFNLRTVGPGAATGVMGPYNVVLTRQ